MANVCVYIFRFITLGFLVAALVILGLLADTRCYTKSTVTGDSADCAITPTCDTILIISVTANSGNYETVVSCPWYPVDLGLGYTGISLGVIFLVVATLSNCFKSPIWRISKIITGWLGVMFLLASAIVMAVDLFKDPLPAANSSSGTVVMTKLFHLVNIILVGISFICSLPLTIYETASKKDKAKGAAAVEMKNGHKKVNM